MQLLRCLTQGENMAELDNEKLIFLVKQYPELYLLQPKNLPSCHVKN